MKLEARLSNRSAKLEEKTTTSPELENDNPNDPHHHHHHHHPADFTLSSSSTSPTTKAAISSSPSSSSSSSSSSSFSLRNHHHHHEESSLETESCAGKFTSCRWVTGYVCCAARFAQVAIRQCIGMAVVCMTLSHGKDSAPHHHRGQGDFNSGTAAAAAAAAAVSHSTSGSDYSAGPSSTGINAGFPQNETVNVPEFAWSSDFEALILNAFNFGFFCSPIVGGHLAGRLGGKRVVLVALVMGSSVTLCLPLAASFSDLFVLLLRVLAGMFLGVVDPAIQSLWARWAPQWEKAQLTTCSFTGVSLAGIFTFFISGYLCSIPLHNGWPFIFYFFGGFALLCILPWMFLVYDSPEDHPRILDYEKTLILKGKRPDSGDKKVQTPWRSMLRSGPVWAIVVSHATYSWVTSWMMSYLPKYLKQMMQFDVKEDGLYSSLPYVGRMVTGFVCGYLSDRMLHSGLLTTGQCRKLFQVAGCAGCALCMLGVGFLDHTSPAAAVVLLVLALSFQNLTSVAFRINHLDIAPRFAGVLMGLSLTVAMAFSLTGPPVTAAIVTQGKQEEWLALFAIVACLNIIGALVFFFLASGDVQPWALPPEQDDQPIVSVVVLGRENLSDTPTTKGTMASPLSGSAQAEDFERKLAKSEENDNTESQAREDKKSDTGRSSDSEASSYDEHGMDTGEDENDGVETTSRPVVVSAAPCPAQKRALSHTMSMPVPYVGVVNKHTLLRKRISSTDVHHQQGNESKGRRENAPAKSPLSTHADGDDGAK
ncbi:hypothetical protein ACOMHN_064939 [Nucella lapillus]